MLLERSSRVLSVLAAGLLASWVAGASAETKEGAGTGKCPAAEKVSALLASWKTAAAEAKALPADELAKCKAQLAAVAKECPVGSRMGETIAFVKAVLSHSIVVEDACAEHCPFAGGPVCPASEAKAARAKLLRDLDELAGYAACAVGSECSAKEKETATAAAKDGAACAESLAARAAELEASWKKAPAELAALPLEKRERIQASVKEIAGRSKAVALVPETVVALGMGFEAIEALNGKLGEWAKAHPEALANIPEDARRKVDGQFALLQSAGKVIRDAAKVCESACKAEKTSTAAR